MRQRGLAAVERAFHAYAEHGVPLSRSDICEQLLLCNAADRFGAQAFVLSDVQRLRELDAESGNNNMLQTLWQYSRCFNTPTAAAKALYIDRSTLHYRLKKISDLMETDLDVPANAQALSASIWLREIYRFSDGADKQN